MIAAYNNNNNNNNNGFSDDPNAASSQMFNQPQAQSAANINNYATEYLNTVKENRSMHGNYVDNSLTYDPHKEKKSVYNVVYETDAYNPWGLCFLFLFCPFSSFEFPKNKIGLTDP